MAVNDNQVLRCGKDDGGLWAPDGLTPEMTLSAAIQSEIKKKGEASRFVRTAPGLFTVRKAEAAPKA